MAGFVPSRTWRTSPGIRKSLPTCLANEGMLFDAPEDPAGLSRKVAVNICTIRVKSGKLRAMSGFGGSGSYQRPTQGRRVDSFHRFSRLTIGVTLVLTTAIAGILAVYDTAAAKGFLLGGLAGAAGFWLMANRARTMGSIAPEELPYRIYRWAFVRIALYAGFLALAYRVDGREYHGLIGAVFGLLIVRVVLTGLGLTMGRVKTENKTNFG